MKLYEVYNELPVKEEEEPTSGDTNIALHLPRGEMKVLRAEGDKYDRGLLVTLLDDGGYDMAYWYEKHVPFEVEVLIDGKMMKKDAKIVTMKFHPELKSLEDKGMKFKLYDIEADIKELRDKIKEPRFNDVNAQALRLSTLQTVEGTLINFKTLLSLSTMFVEMINKEVKEDE